jgi:hypothetical protein
LDFTFQMVEPLLDAVARFRAELLRQDVQALGRLMDAYGRAYARLGYAVDALLLEIGDQAMTAGQVMRMERYKALMKQTGDELLGFQALTINEAEKAAQLGIQLGSRHGRELISYTATGTPQIAGAFNVLPRDAIQSVLGFLQPDAQLYKRLRLIAPNTASLVSDAITSGVAMGFNPRKTAAIIQDAFGNGLTDALRQVRTVQLYSYREANRATFLVNADVVEGWIWHAHLGDTRTCMSCIAMHGTEHPLTESLNDHYNGRCAMVPKVPGYDNPVKESGQEWFEKQSETRQKEHMSDAKWEAWKEGKFGLSDMPVDKNDRVYGMMKTEQSLKALIGE